MAAAGLAFASRGLRASDLAPAALTCEYAVDPVGLGTPRPRLGWQLIAEERGALQGAYRILCASRPGLLAPGRADLADTGRVASSRTQHVAYPGDPLGSHAVVHWKVRVWDADGDPSPWSEPARFTTGILSPGDWKAAWIHAPGPLPPRHAAHNGYHSAFAAEAYTTKRVVVDLGTVRTIDGVRLHPARPFDWEPDTPAFLFPLRYRIDVATRGDLADARTAVDRTAQDIPSPGTTPRLERFGPVQARYVRLVVPRLRARGPGEHAFALAELEILRGDENLARGGKVRARDPIESGAWSKGRLVDGVRVSRPATGDEPRPPTLLRRDFRVRGPVRRATVTVSALGLYELRLDGERVGDDVLAPGWTDYRQRVPYRTYEVTSLLREGRNALGAWLGDGWYAGRIGLALSITDGPGRGLYGRRPRLLVQLDIQYADGSRETVATDGSWRATTEGPIRRSCILDGEVVDARRKMPGWDRPGFDDSGWRPAAVDQDVGARLVASACEPMRVVRDVEPVRITEPRPGAYVVDLGQNIVGWCRLRLRAERGTTVTLRHAEVLRPDGGIYTENLRSAEQTDRYTCRGGGEEVFEPRFSYHGFRYVEVSGLPGPPALDDLVGRVVHTDAPEVSSFESSSEDLDGLMDCVLWTLRGNLHSLPTDCPQRDERLGWLGDAQIVSRTACFRMRLARFYTKWLADIRDAQAADGRYPDFAPHPFDPGARFSGAPGWADAGVLIPWRVWVQYGDLRLLEEHFDSARRWVGWVRSQSPELLWTGSRGNDYGDWLNGGRLDLEGWEREGCSVPNEVLATAYFARSARLVARMAAVLGKDRQAAECARLARDVRQAFREAYVDDQGRVRGDTQAGYALALGFDLVPERLRPRLVQHLAEGIEARDGALTTGIQTTRLAMEALVRGGRTELAYRLLERREVPSWLYMLDQGATTIWERWDGFVEDRGFQDPGMNSFNHYAFGSVGEWVDRHVLGLAPDPEHPGWRRFRVAPRPGGSLTRARGSHETIRGRIEVAWRRDGDALRLEVAVPAGTAATVRVPLLDGAPEAHVTEGGRPLAEAPGVRVDERTARAVICAVDSGQYRFEVER